MKLELDFDNKIVKLTDKINFKELKDLLEKILPNYEEWEIDTNTNINWSSPIIIKESPYRPQPWWDQQPIITYDVNSLGTDDLTANQMFNHIQGTYQLEFINDK